MDEEGAPIAPYEASIKIIDWCGVIVRYKVPIIIRNWNPSNKDDQHAMPASDKCFGGNLKVYSLFLKVSKKK